jgi:hypothetical protein
MDTAGQEAAQDPGLPADQPGADPTGQVPAEGVTPAEGEGPAESAEPESYLVPIKKYGISHAVVLNPGVPDWKHEVENPDYDPEKEEDETNKKMIVQPRFDFVIQFVWIEPEDEEMDASSQPPSPGPGGFGQAPATR